MDHRPKATSGPEVADRINDMVQTMARVRAALNRPDGRKLDRDQAEFFEYVASQLAKYESVRDNPIVNVVNHSGNYWRNWLLLIARSGPYRPSMIRKLLTALDPTHPISQRMLTLNLRLLERDGLILREVFDDERQRRHVEYSLTPIGRDLSDRLTSLIAWIDRHSVAIAEARVRFDSESSSGVRYEGNHPRASL